MHISSYKTEADHLTHTELNGKIYHRLNQLKDQQDWQSKESGQHREENRYIKRLECVWGEH